MPCPVGNLPLIPQIIHHLLKLSEILAILRTHVKVDA